MNNSGSTPETLTVVTGVGITVASDKNSCSNYKTQFLLILKRLRFNSSLPDYLGRKSRNKSSVLNRGKTSGRQAQESKQTNSDKVSNSNFNTSIIRKKRRSPDKITIQQQTKNFKNYNSDVTKVNEALIQKLSERSYRVSTRVI
jgi:hypothetical protein